MYKTTYVVDVYLWSADTLVCNSTGINRTFKMVNALSVAAVAASLLAIPTVNAAGGMYTKSSPVLQIDGKSYRNLVENSNHTTVSQCDHHSSSASTN